MLRLLERHGCQGFSAPSMREVPLSDQHEAFAFGEELLRGDHEVLVLLTGVGTRMLVDALSSRHPQADVLAAFGRCQLVCRGPKPVAALKALGLKPTLVAPEPNTWQDLVRLLDAELPVAGRKLAVQAYGKVNQPLLDALRERGAAVRSVGIYAWELPADLAPLTAAVDRLSRAEADVVLFTAAQQVEHLFQIAEREGKADALQAALRARVVCASIGPIMSEALAARGLPVDLVPEHPKMGHLVQSVVKSGAELARSKRAAAG
jgi:uroporphyrinogen-III synthase